MYKSIVKIITSSVVAACLSASVGLAAETLSGDELRELAETQTTPARKLYRGYRQVNFLKSEESAIEYQATALTIS